MTPPCGAARRQRSVEVPDYAASCFFTLEVFFVKLRFQLLYDACGLRHFSAAAASSIFASVAALSYA